MREVQNYQPGLLDFFLCKTGVGVNLLGNKYMILQSLEIIALHLFLGQTIPIKFLCLHYIFDVA